MKCKNCSGSKFIKLNEKVYKCENCGLIRQLTTDDTYVSQKEGSNPKFIFLIIISIFIIAIAFGFFSYQTTVHSPEDRADVIESASEDKAISKKDKIREEQKDEKLESEKLAEYGTEQIEELPPPQGKLYQVSVHKTPLKSVYFYGMYKNTGKVTIDKPKLELTLYSKSGRKVLINTTYAFKDFLLPGEETGVRFLVIKAPKYESYKIEHQPKHLSTYRGSKRPKLKLQKVKLKKIANRRGYRVVGEALNVDNLRADFSQIMAILYDKNKKIIGMNYSYLGKQKLAPNNYSPFNFDVYFVFGEVASFKLDYNTKHYK